MIRAGGNEIINPITRLANRIIYEGKIPEDCNLSYIVSCYKGKGDALSRDSYRGLKLLEQVLKIIERILETVIRSQVDIDSMQFGFVPGRSTTDAIFISRQMQEKHLEKRKDLYFAFVDLEKAFDRVPREVLWWAMRKAGVEEWVITTVMATYENAKSSVRLNNEYSNEFDIKVGVHQGAVLSPLLFIIVMEALSREFKIGCPWELLYADDLVIICDSLEELKQRILIWKVNFESKGLRINMNKTKVLHSNHNTFRKVDPSE